MECRAIVAGVGTTIFGKQPSATVASLASEAARLALGDARVGVPDIQAVFFSNAADGVLTGQEMIRGQVALQDSGLLGRPVVNVENACASGATAFHMSVLAVESGQYDTVLVLGVEKMTVPDRSKIGAALTGAVDRAWLERQSLGSSEQQALFMQLYAQWTKEYFEHTGATATDVARVVCKNRRHAAANPVAMFRETLTIDDVLSAKVIAEPLTRPMCSPIGDGAAALVVMAPERASRMGVIQPVTVAATALIAGRPDIRKAEQSDASGYRQFGVRRAASLAYEQAGVDPNELDVVELHDATASAELILYEELGLCPEGEAVKLIADNTTSLGGARPVNVSGGLISKGHPIGATGCGQLVELVTQLRGRAGDRQVDGARMALAENAGGYLGSTGDTGASAVTILRSS